MNKNIQKSLVILWVLLFVLLIHVVLQYYGAGKIMITEERVRNQLVVMAVREEDGSDLYLQQQLELYSAIPGNPYVEIKYVSQSSFQKQLYIDKDQNNLPDLIIFENVMTSALQSMGMLKDLSEYMTPDRTAEYLKVAYSSTIVNGSCYAVPFNSNPYVIFYNKDHLEKFNLVVPENMEELYQLCRTTKILGTYNLGLAGKNKQDISASFLQMIYSAGGTLRSSDTEHCQQLYKMLGRMRDEEIISQDVINWNQKDLISAFSTGYVKIAIAKLSAMSLLEQSDIMFRYQVAEIPHSLKRSFLFQGNNIGITTTADEKEAIKLLDYLTSKAIQENYYEHTYCLSVRTDLIVNPGRERGLADEFVERQRNQSVLKSVYSTWFIISDAIAGNLSTFFGDKTITPEEICWQMQQDIRDAILER